MLTLTNSFLLLEVLKSVPILVKIDQEMRPWGCIRTYGYTNTRDTLTDANRFYKLSHAIYSSEADKKNYRAHNRFCCTSQNIGNKREKSYWQYSAELQLNKPAFRSDERVRFHQGTNYAFRPKNNPLVKASADRLQFGSMTCGGATIVSKIFIYHYNSSTPAPIALSNRPCYDPAYRRISSPAPLTRWRRGRPSSSPL